MSIAIRKFSLKTGNKQKKMEKSLRRDSHKIRKKTG
jgi:hypothetical protein